MATAQTCSIIEYNGLPGLKKITWTWTCTDLGILTGARTTNKYTGELLRLITDPGSPAPTDNYDLTILDDDNIDALIGAGMNRHTTTTQQVIASSLGCVFESKLSAEIVVAGNATAGVICLYIKDVSGRR